MVRIRPSYSVATIIKVVHYEMYMQPRLRCVRTDSVITMNLKYSTHVMYFLATKGGESTRITHCKLFLMWVTNWLRYHGESKPRMS